MRSKFLTMMVTRLDHFWLIIFMLHLLRMTNALIKSKKTKTLIHQRFTNFIKYFQENVLLVTVAKEGISWSKWKLVNLRFLLDLWPGLGPSVETRASKFTSHPDDRSKRRIFYYFNNYFQRWMSSSILICTLARERPFLSSLLCVSAQVAPPLSPIGESH